ncbi:hypothetical protein [Streptomyces avermitilis]|uniref:hypothetical protein n=1 Tax=Streptomyces avermitilis TaxID=33903 RepID=UPI0033B9E393
MANRISHVGTTFTNVGVENKVTLYRGNTVFRASDTDTLGSIRFPLTLPPEELRYRLVSENSRGTWENHFSTRTRTEWLFASGRPSGDALEQLPLVQLR